ncbi:hypothetical protein HDF16_003261 [Granulicella aggregans]|jgi:hypothetical protein|uniref:Uncharacterized protein n=1 Tax=Granulicella aggregans TaxID=474949 RepID=A0A7W8E4E5_9BACT|nr:hypothetical protein [Granulicella aggregans]
MSSEARKPLLSLDTWAVILSLGLALLIKLGVFKTITW